MKNIVLGIKGFFIGLANIIPGVSGGTLALTLGIYEQLISCISHIFKNLKENIKFLLPIAIGAIIAIISLSHVISFSLENYVLPTILFFIGAILGGLPMLLKKVKGSKLSISNVLVFLITFSIIILLLFLNSDNVVSFENMHIINYILLFIVGIITSATMVIPGVSGSAVLMTIGYYKPVIDVIKDITNFSNLANNLMILIPFGIGVVVGILLIAKLLEFLFKNYEVKTYYGVLGFIISSIFAIIYQNLIINSSFVFTIPSLIIGIILFILGFGIAYKLGDK